MIAIAGGGLAAQRCCERLRRRGYDGRIAMFSDEPHAPYDRPPLSKQFLSGATNEAPRLRPESWYQDNDVELVLGDRAVELRPDTRTLVLASGANVRYDKLLVATGARPRILPGCEQAHNVQMLRTLADAAGLRERLTTGTRLLVIGAGFIGQEVASTARKLGVEVTLLEAMGTPLAHLVGERVGGWFTRLHREEGVEVRVNTAFHPSLCARYDTVVMGVGVEPATHWLAGTPIGPNGTAAVRTDHAGRTCLPDVFAAGDCTGSQHWEAAVHQGAGAALAMLGEPTPPPPASSFWSDLYDVRINWIGDAREADSVEIDGDLATRDFAATYRRDGKAVAGLLVGRPQALPQLRKELA